MNRNLQTDDVRVIRLHELESPSDLVKRLPVSPRAATTIGAARDEIHRILTGEHDRSLVVVEGIVESRRTSLIRTMAELFKRYSKAALVVPLVPSESKSQVRYGASKSAHSIRGLFEHQRRTLLELNEAGIPAGAVLEDTISPQYLSDLVS